MELKRRLILKKKLQREVAYDTALSINKILSLIEDYKIEEERLKEIKRIALNRASFFFQIPIERILKKGKDLSSCDRISARAVKFITLYLSKLSVTDNEISILTNRKRSTITIAKNNINGLIEVDNVVRDEYLAYADLVMDEIENLSNAL